MSNWSVGGEKWIKANLESGGEFVFRVSDVRYVRSQEGGCKITMNDGEVFGVKFSAEEFFNLL